MAEKKFDNKLIDNYLRLKKWGLKGGLAVSDQVIFSGANFFSSVLLAKWLSDTNFGEFAIGLAVLSFFMQVYTSFALEPMSVLGPSGYQDRLPSYLMGQVWLLIILTVPTSAVLGVLALFSQIFNSHSDYAAILLISAISLPFFLLPILMRRIFYVLFKPGVALIGSIVYLVILLASFFIVEKHGFLRGGNSILIVALASFSSGLILVFLLLNQAVPREKIDLKHIFFETWSFGKWLVISGVLIGLATQSQVYLAGLLSSTEDAGVVRILQTFTQPMMLTFTAFSALATPVIVNDFVSRKYKSMRQKIFLFTLFTSVMAFVYECLLILYGSSLNNALFGEKYSAYSSQIPIWGLVPVVWALFWGGGIALQAIKKPQAMVVISGLWAFFSLISGLILIPALGVEGATISMVLGFVVAFISVWVLYWIMVYTKYT